MPYYYKGFDHTNTTDDEEEVANLTSNEAEKIKVVSIVITYVNNDGYLNAYFEREKVIEEICTGDLSIQNGLEIPIDRELPVGKTFKVTLKNKTSDVNATLRGFIKYQIL